MLTELKKGTKVIGAKQTKRAMADGRAVTLFLAKDADPSMTVPMETMGTQQGVPVVWVKDMYTLGQACGIAVGSAVAAMVR